MNFAPSLVWMLFAVELVVEIYSLCTVRSMNKRKFSLKNCIWLHEVFTQFTMQTIKNIDNIKFCEII